MNDNSRFKFRVWNKTEKMMYLSPSELEHMGSWLDSHLPGAIADKNNIVIMQWTGLTDPNGRDIFEEDIVKCSDCDNTMVVEYKEIQASDDMTAPGMGFQFNTYPENMEIIGNIYQNPELLVEETTD